MENKITIIVPMYNEEKNVASCIEVLKSQTNQNFDVFFIDDGSVDNTVTVLQNTLEEVKFSYYILLQQNQGAAEARKTGINHSKTEYIAILDCDDAISSDYMEQFYAISSKLENVDIIIPNAEMQDKNDNWVSFRFYTNDVNLNSLEAVKNTLGGWKVHGWFCIKKHIILESYENYSKYNPNCQNYINNDEVITRYNLLNAKNIVRSTSTYYYHYNIASTTKSINDKKYLTLRNSSIMKEAFAGIPSLHKSICIEMINSVWSTFKYYQIHKESLTNKGTWMTEIKAVIGQISYQEYLFILPLKEKIKLILLKENFGRKMQ